MKSSEILSVLDEWRQNGHPAYQLGSWNVEELVEFENSNRSMTDLLEHCIDTVDDEGEKSLRQAMDTYVNDEDDYEDGLGDLDLGDIDKSSEEGGDSCPDDEDNGHDVSDDVVIHNVDSDSDNSDDSDKGDIEIVESEPESDDDSTRSDAKEPHDCDGDNIVLLRAGIVNSNNIGEDRAELAKQAIQCLRVAHDDDPVNTYDNPDFWVNSMPWLFPFGCGGAENDDRPSELTLTEWIRHCLDYHDDRFRKDPAFIFVCYKIKQIRDRYMHAKNDREHINYHLTVMI